MANSKISALTSATTPLAGTETLPVVQSSTTKKATVEQLATATQPSGTANGVMYLNGSKIPTTGSTFNFNGSQLGFGVAASSAYGFRQIYTGSGAASQYGMYLDSFSDSSGTGNTVSIRARARTSAAAYTTALAADFQADSIGLGAGSTITTAAGMVIQDQTAGTTNIGLYSLVSAGTAKYNIYASGTASNYMAGGLNIGATTNPGAGNLSLTGNVIQGTAAKGVNFTANTPAAGMTSQLLNWYEEGTWTVTLTPGTSGTIGLYSTFDVCQYTRIGRMMFVSGQIKIISTSVPVGTFVRMSLPSTIADLPEIAGRMGSTVSKSNIVYAALAVEGANYIDIQTAASGFAVDEIIAFSFSYVTS